MMYISLFFCLVIGGAQSLTIRNSWKDNDDKWGPIVDKIEKDNAQVKDSFRETMKKQAEIEAELNELENVFQKDDSKSVKDALEPGKDALKPEKRSSLEGEALMMHLIKEHGETQEEINNGIPHIPTEEDDDAEFHEEHAENVKSKEDSVEGDEKRQIVIDEESEDATDENFAEELENDNEKEEKDEGFSLVNDHNDDEEDHSLNKHNKDESKKDGGEASTEEMIMKLSSEDDKHEREIAQMIEQMKKDA
ncbi:uncharacterized protein [Clytia hemisphaerica]